MGLVGEVRPNVARWLYFSGFLVTAIVTWVLRDYSKQLLSNIGELNKCLQGPDGSTEGTCVGKGAVLRISFGNLLFFALHFVLTLGVKREDDPRRLIHTGFWPIKVLLWGGLLGMTFALPNHVLQGYGQFARVLSGIFLVFQIVVLLDWIYQVNDWLLAKETRTHSAALVLGAFVFHACSLALLGVCYHYYAPAASCSLNIFFITWTLILALGYTALSVSSWRVENAGLLTAGAVFIYTAFLVWSALSSEPPGRCQVGSGSNSQGVKVVGFLLALGSVLYNTLDTGMQGRSFELGERAAGDLAYRPDFFHAIFAMASAYLAMVFTAWSLQDTPGEFSVDRGTWFSVWVKMVSQWVCVILYVWTLVAPKLLHNRNFG